MIRNFISSSISSFIHPHIREHLFYYASMTLLQLIGFYLVLSSAPNIALQMALIIFTTILYLLWAILHHYLHHDLHPAVVIEYVLIGLLGISISYFIFRIQA